MPVSAASSAAAAGTPRRRNALAIAEAIETSLISSRSCSSGVGDDQRLASTDGLDRREDGGLDARAHRLERGR